jgi:hypothetical protein
MGSHKQVLKDRTNAQNKQKNTRQYYAPVDTDRNSSVTLFFTFYQPKNPQNQGCFGCRADSDNFTMYGAQIGVCKHCWEA